MSRTSALSSTVGAEKSNSKSSRCLFACDPTPGLNAQTNLLGSASDGTKTPEKERVTAQ
jgi:hypothetical protein